MAQEIRTSDASTDRVSFTTESTVSSSTANLQNVSDWTGAARPSSDPPSSSTSPTALTWPDITSDHTSTIPTSEYSEGLVAGIVVSVVGAVIIVGLAVIITAGIFLLRRRRRCVNKGGLDRTPPRSRPGQADYYVYAPELQRREVYARTFRGEGPLPNAMRMMKVVFEASFGSEQRTHDVFVHYHWKEHVWVHEVLLLRLQGALGMSVKSEDDIDLGSYLVEELIECILHCEYLVLTFSQSYVNDALCRDFSVRAYSLRPDAVVPIAFPPLSIGQLEADTLFRAIIITNGVLYWSDDVEEREVFWAALYDRLKEDSNAASLNEPVSSDTAGCAAFCTQLRCCIKA